MEIDEALARIAELEGQLSTLTVERDGAAGQLAETTGRLADLTAQLGEATSARDALAGELTTAQAAGLAALRRALLAEQAGQIVPELVSGETEEALLASVDVAKGAYTRALETARAALARQSVPAGAPSARTTPVAGLSPLALIETGLRK
ncbi:MAG: hypothetical protein IT306_27435 [Chloroflexi bacterium]|nr:hypothetical protein [Chloroflexota bacterium]